MRAPPFRAARCLALLGLVLVGLGAGPAAAQNPPPLIDRLTPEVMAIVYPSGAERLGEAEGKPPSIAVYQGEDVVAYIFSTLDVVRAPGYSSYPFDVIAGVTPQGEITGAVVIDHREPHISGDRTRTRQLDEFLTSQAGLSLDRGQPNAMRPDYVRGATVSARAMRAGITDSARFVLQLRLGRPPVTEPTLDRLGFWPMTYEEMVANGSLARIQLTNADVAALMEANGVVGATLERPLRAPEELYSEVTIALAMPFAISRNVLTPGSMRYIEELPEGGIALMIGSRGRYDVFGNAYNHLADGYRFDRFRVVQGEHVYTFTRDNYQRVSASRNGGGMQYTGLFFLPEDSGFDVLAPWRLDFLINGPPGDANRVSMVVPVTYTVPPALVLMPPAPPVPAYVEAWTEARTDVIVLVATLLVLTLILAFQGVLARHRRLFNTVRNAFLLFTLVWLGWMSGGQLSTIHLINYATAPMHDFDIGFYLSEPIIVILAAYTLISVVIIGRGVFCGWLCPFGALQELLAKVARALRLPQWNPSEAVQKRLWLGKYIAAVVVIGATFASPEIAAATEEIEPFKTAITSFFSRAWPFEVYAVSLLLFGLFTERAYCRFLCPLGGTLAALDRLHLVDVLKRRPECGSPCKLCEHSCPVKAIEHSGKINMAECFQCLDCQVEYYDDHRCPPLVKARKRLARATRGTPVRIPTLVPAAARESLA